MTKRPKVEGETRVESEDWPTFFTMVPEWVTFSAISDRAHRIYSVLAAHLRRDTDSRVTGVITQADLAALVGIKSNPERVRPYIAELEELAAVRVIEDWDAVRKIPITRYVVRFNPPPGFTGHRRVQDWQEERRSARAVRIAERWEKEARRKAKAAGQPVTRKNEGHDTGNSEGHQTRKNAGPSTDEPHPYETSSDDTAPSARSAADVRRTTTGSSAREADSGCAATDKPLPAPDDVEEPAGGDVPSPQEPGEVDGVVAAPRPAGGKAGARKHKPSPFPPHVRQQIYATEALLPPPMRAALAELLPHGHLPNTTRKVIAQALETRTPAELGERAARRWNSYGYERDHYDGELRSPIGVVEELLRPTPYCPAPDCEDGVDRHTDQQCTPCATRIEQRKRDRMAGRTVPTHRPPRLYRNRAECDVCQKPLPADPPEDLLCTDCRGELEDARAFLNGASVGEPDLVRDNHPDAAYRPNGPNEEYRAAREQRAAARRAALAGARSSHQPGSPRGGTPAPSIAHAGHPAAAD